MRIKMIEETSNRWLSITANLGVLVGLILVIFEMRQNQELMKVNLTNHYYSSYAQAEMLFAGENLPAVWEKSLLDPKNLSLKEMRILEAHTYAPITRWINLYRLSEAGILENRFWQTQVNVDAGYYLGTPYGRAYWDNIKPHALESNFIPMELLHYIDDILADADPQDMRRYFESIRAAIK